MKALSVKQPWAGLIRSGYKTIETRIWSTDYRGDLLICSSQRIDKKVMSQFDDLFTPIELTQESLTTGVSLCIVELYDCKVMTLLDEERALCNMYGEGRWKARSFFLKNIRPIKPFPVKGALGMFEVNVEPKNLILI
jgi:hypothetical protein